MKHYGACCYWEMITYKAKQSNSPLRQPTSHHPGIDYLLIKAHPVVLYSILTKILTCLYMIKVYNYRDHTLITVLYTLTAVTKDV